MRKAPGHFDDYELPPLGKRVRAATPTLSECDERESQSPTGDGDSDRSESREPEADTVAVRIPRRLEPWLGLIADVFNDHPTQLMTFLANPERHRGPPMTPVQRLKTQIEACGREQWVVPDMDMISPTFATFAWMIFESGASKDQWGYGTAYKVHIAYYVHGLSMLQSRTRAPDVVQKEKDTYGDRYKTRQHYHTMCANFARIVQRVGFELFALKPVMVTHYKGRIYRGITVGSIEELDVLEPDTELSLRVQGHIQMYKDSQESILN